MAGILIFKAREALTKDYRRTEMWLYLEKDTPARGLRAMGELHGPARHLLTFALWTSAIAIAMWVIALIFLVFGP